MKNYEETLENDLTKIVTELDRLDTTLGKLEENPGKVKAYFEQGKAIHEIKKTVKDCKKFVKDAVAPAKETADNVLADAKAKGDMLDKMDKTLDTLDTDLAKLDEDEDSKVKSYILQKKSIHEIKKLLNQEGLYEKYDDKELDDLGL